MTEIMTDRLGYYLSPLTATQALVAGGKVDALATTGRKRSPGAPDIPTTIEAGYPDSDFDFWVGLFAPAKTPPEIVERCIGRRARYPNRRSSARRWMRSGASRSSP